MELVRFFASEIALAGAALCLLTLDFMAARLRSAMTLLAAAAVTLAVVVLPPSGAGQSFFSAGSLTGGFSIIVLLGTLTALAFSREDPSIQKNWGSFLALLLLASAGCLLLLKSRDFIFAFIAIELISISSFILAAFERRELHQLEGALKYFLVGAFSSAIGLYGISLYYAGAGTTGFGALGRLFQADGAAIFDRLTLAGLMLVFVSFAFPVIKSLKITPVFSALACLTMTVGNVSAIHQNDDKRLLAYSSIAQAGYMMLGILAATSLASGALLLYGCAYLFMNLGAFGCIQWVERRRGSTGIEACDGLALTNLPFALTFCAFLLSLAGIPPLVGFLGKYAVFAGVLEAGQFWWVAVVAGVNAVIGAYYYLRIVYRMFFVEKEAGAPAAAAGFSTLSLTIGILLLGTLAFGLYPKPLLALINLKF
ncbi:MAG: hypothetical protein HY747_00175 [Elusimicrobia bacterium]|nr:hypothetical protein [Elusimicrobiota bacterium]